MRRSIVRREQILTGASQSRHIKPTALALAVAACFSGAALANPTNPTVVHGTASFQQAGNILNITNSANAIINWGSFSISVGELTRFIQPSALSAVLNRVTGQDPSVILGALQSNGRVFLINPNGILFGAGSQVDVAGLVASTLNLSNDDFLNNRMRFTDGAGAGSVVNQGQITGGSVYLVGNAVTNNGLITSPNGEVVLAAGNSVELVNPGTPNLRVEVVAGDNEARNLGTISAEAGRIGIYAGLIRNSGTLNASSAVAEGGRILLKAKKDITLESTSVIDASGRGGGEIIAFADNNMYVDGVLNASAPVSSDGGFIETSGKNRVKVAGSAFITTKAASGKTGTWLIDPMDYLIDPEIGDISGFDLSQDLENTNVVIASTQGSVEGGGDIVVNDGISWSSDNSLTLTAVRNVVVNETISNTGNGALNLYAGWNESSPEATPTLKPGIGSVIINNLDGNFISVGSTINMAAGDLVQIFAPVTATSRSYGGAASISLTGRQIEINESVRAVGGNGSGDGIGGNAQVLLSAGAGSIEIDFQGSLEAYGGNGGYGGGGVPGGAGGNALIRLTAGGQINQSGLINSYGGNTGYDSAYGGSTGGNGVIELTSSSQINIFGDVYANGGFGIGGGAASISMSGTTGVTVGDYTWVEAIGGNGFSSYGGNPTGGVASVQLSSSRGSINVIDGGEIYVSGGNGGQNGGLYANGGAATAKLTAAQGIQIDGSEGYSYVQARGGSGNTGGDARVELLNTGSPSAIGLTNGAGIYVQGGDGAEGGNGGVGVVMLSSAGSVMLSDAYINTYGGGGALNGGAGIVALSSAESVMLSDANINTYGGNGGLNGGASQITVSASGNTTVSNTSLWSSGGYGYNGQGGAASVNLFAGGNVQVEGAEGTAWGGGGSTAGGLAGVNVIAGGAITVDNLGGIEGGEGMQGFAMSFYNNFEAFGGDSYGGSIGASSVVLAAASNVNLINGASVDTDGVVGLGGANVILDNAYVSADSGIQVDTSGSLQLTNGSSLYSGQNVVINTGGGVLVDYSYVSAANDVIMKVGTAVNMSNGGVISAGSPTTINLTFPLLASGGFFVNGIEGVVFDEATFTGFMANGDAAVLGESLKIVYGGGSVLNVPTDALIVAMGQSTKPPDPEKDKDVFEEISDEKKKDAPVCR